MKCPNCGHEVREGLAFCTNCGSPLPRMDTSAKGAAQQGQRTARPNICPRCGSTLPEGCEFCPNCGARVAGGVGPVAPQAPTASPVDPSRTQAMPVVPQNPPRVQAVPSPSQRGYSVQGNSGEPARTDASKTLLIVAGVVVAVVVAAVAVMAVLGMGPFQRSTASDDGQNVAEVANGSVAANDNQGGNSNASGNVNAASTNTSSANANQNASTANSNANASGGANASDNANASSASSSANANATGDDGTLGSVSLSGGYVSNSNSAYGYSLRVPTSFTLAGSDSVGNATLTDTASPCVITVSVDDNPNGYTVDQALANASAGASSSAYTAKGNGWYVVSDEPNGSVYYVMSYVQQGRTISLRFSYPSSAKSQCDPIIESVQPTFSVN